MDLQKLRQRLKAAGLTQRDVADRLGRAHSQVSRMLSGKTRMRVDTLNAIEGLLAEAEKGSRGVAETPSDFVQKQGALIPFITLEQAKALRDKPRIRLSEEERERFFREMMEIAEAGRRLPRLTDMSDEEILGYDENQ